MILNYLLALFLTLILEFIVFCLFGYRDKKALLTVLGINLVTHPLLGVVLFIKIMVSGTMFSFLEIILLELIIVLVESVFLYYIYLYKYYKLLFLAFIANLVSFLLGLMVF
ncbi:MAG: hypothetical protein K9M44_02260 [Candidatus Pacebacteria bacterium]|nr:hypothetical protein [Candidatus Paceibacterota bacterium]